jgi:hypothetical protein
MKIGDLKISYQYYENNIKNTTQKNILQNLYPKFHKIFLGIKNKALGPRFPSRKHIKLRFSAIIRTKIILQDFCIVIIIFF